jgi:chromosome segregation ATPase
MEEVEEMDCPGLEDAVEMAILKERLMEIEAKEKVWNETMEHILKTMFATNAELAELQSTHKKEMQKHEMDIHKYETELAKIQVVLKERTKACKQAQKACPLMLAKIDSLQAENARQASAIAELRDDNERLSRVLEACQILDE